MRDREPGTVLLLGNYRPSVTVIRKLHARSIPVVLGVAGPSERIDSVERARDAGECLSHPVWSEETSSLAAAFRDLLRRRPDIRTLFPVSDLAVRRVDALRGELPPDITLVLPAAGIVERCANKFAMLELCQLHDVPVAPYRCVTDRRELRLAADEVGEPLVVKPLDSSHLMPGDRKALVCLTRAELESALPEWPDQHRRLLVQRYVTGARHNVYFAARHGTVLGAVELRIARTDRVDGTGFAVSGESVAPGQETRHLTERIVRHLDYTGAGCTQFLIDPASRAICFLELNPRLGANFAAVEHCGLPLAMWALELALGRDVEPRRPDPWSYPVGRCFAWTTGDLMGLRFELHERRLAPRDIPRRLLRTIADAARADTHITWSWRDPLPTLCEYLRPLGYRGVASGRSQT